MSASRRVLFICPQFHSYHLQMASALERAGAKLYPVFYQENQLLNCSFFSLLSAAFYRACYQFTGYKTFKIRQLIARKKGAACAFDSLSSQLTAPTNIELIVLVKGFVFDKKSLTYLKQTHPNAKLVLYQWDSFDLYRTTLELIGEFDAVYSFQSGDQKLNKRIQYLPTPHHQKLSIDVQIVPLSVNAVSYVGSFSLFRYRKLSRIRQQLLQLGIKVKFRLVAPSWLCKILDQNIVTPEQLTAQQTTELYRQTGAVLDIGQPYHCGLSQRFFHALSLGCRVFSDSAEALTLKSELQGWVFELTEINEASWAKKPSSTSSQQLVSLLELRSDSYWAKTLLEATNQPSNCQ